MERYCMQNHYTCRSNRMSENHSMKNRSFSGDCFDDTAIYKHADHLPLTMAYVPMQKFSGTFSLQKSLSCGTVFRSFVNHFVEREVVADESVSRTNCPVSIYQ